MSPLDHDHPVMRKMTGHVVGHAHIDFQWLWEWPETVQVCKDTFGQACKFMDAAQKGSCAQYHLNQPLSFYQTIHFWKTPVADCGNGKKDCMDYNAWQRAWTQVTG